MGWDDYYLEPFTKHRFWGGSYECSFFKSNSACSHFWIHKWLPHHTFPIANTQSWSLVWPNTRVSTYTTLPNSITNHYAIEPATFDFFSSVRATTKWSLNSLFPSIAFLHSYLWTVANSECHSSYERCINFPRSSLYGFEVLDSFVFFIWESLYWVSMCPKFMLLALTMISSILGGASNSNSFIDLSLYSVLAV